MPGPSPYPRKESESARCLPCSRVLKRRAVSSFGEGKTEGRDPPLRRTTRKITWTRRAIRSAGVGHAFCLQMAGDQG